MLTLLCLALVTLLLVFLWLRPSGFDEGNEFVRTVAQVIGGFALLAGLYFTAENARTSAKTYEHTQRSERNERFFKSVELLGDKESEGAHIGALFALEQLANESDAHYHQVIEAVCAFVRSRSETTRPRDPLTLDEKTVVKAPHDIHVAMTILGRRRYVLGRGEQKSLDLQGANLCKLRLNHAEFQLANLSDAVLIGTQLDDCNLAMATLNDAYAQYSMWADTILTGTRFVGTDLRRASIFFSGWLPNPMNRVAYSVTSGIHPNTELTYELDPDAYRAEAVTPGSYLEHSSWASAELDEASIMDLTFLGAPLDSRTEPLDLSGMRDLTVEQWESFRKPDDAIQPELFDVAGYKRSHAEASEPFDNGG